MASVSRSVFLLVAVGVAVASATIAAGSNAAVPSAASRRSLYFESHGRDDLREWPAAILKGARYLKVDFNFQPDPYSCAVQTRLPANNHSALPPPVRFPHGCFVLCHYYRNSTRDFNTTVDLVDMLGSPAMQSLIAGLPDGASSGLVVQMCLKNKPALSCTAPSEDALKYIALYDAFYAAAVPMLNANPSHPIRFVFDSLGYDESCYFSRWPRFVATYTGASPQAASNNSGASAEFQMVNMAAAATSSWDFLGSGDFYKFPNASFAFVAWEPATQSEIQAFQKRYLGYDVTPVHEPGMIMAYNGDPALFHVFTANTTGQHTNAAVGSTRSKAPVVTYIESWGVLISCAVQHKGFGGSSVQLECTAMARGQNAKFAPIKTSLAEGTSGPCPDGVAFAFPAPTVDAIYVDGANAAPALPFFISSGLSATRGQISRAADGSIVFNVSRMSTVFVNATSLGPHSAAHLRVQRDPAGASYTVMAGFLSSDNRFVNVAVTPNLTIPLVGVVTVNPAALVQVAASGLTASSKDVSISHSFVGDGSNDQPLRIMVVWSGDRAVYSVAAYMWVSATQGVSTTTVGPGKVGVGRHPSVDVAADGTVTMAYGDSFCYNSELVDDDMLLFWGQKICNLQDASVFEVLPNPVLSYVTGAFADVVARLRQASTPRNGFATVCDAEVLHGTFDLGYSPAVLSIPKEAARFGDDSLLDGSRWIVAASESLAIEDLVCTCGTPVSHGERVVIDAFPTKGFYNRTAVAQLAGSGP